MKQLKYPHLKWGNVPLEEYPIEYAIDYYFILWMEFVQRGKYYDKDNQEEYFERIRDVNKRKTETKELIMSFIKNNA